jgi:hypothetical protein
MRGISITSPRTDRRYYQHTNSYNNTTLGSPQRYRVNQGGKKKRCPTSEAALLMPAQTGIAPVWAGLRLGQGICDRLGYCIRYRISYE